MDGDMFYATVIHVAEDWWNQTFHDCYYGINRDTIPNNLKGCLFNVSVDIYNQSSWSLFTLVYTFHANKKLFTIYVGVHILPLL